MLNFAIPSALTEAFAPPVNSKWGREFENWTTAVKTVCGRLNDANANLIAGSQMGIPPDRASKLPVGRQTGNNPNAGGLSLWSARKTGLSENDEAEVADKPTLRTRHWSRASTTFRNLILKYPSRYVKASFPLLEFLSDLGQFVRWKDLGVDGVQSVASLRIRSPAFGRPGSGLRKRQIHVADSFVYLLRTLEPDRGTVHARILESKPHRLHTVIVTILELPPTAQLHTDYTKPFFLQKADVIDHFANVVGVIRVLIGLPVHAGAVVVDADQSHIEPLGAGI